MSEKFHTEMEVAKGKVLLMGHLAVGMLEDAVLALEENDPHRAEEVRKRKRDLSDQANALEEEMYRLIALYQPMAKDMRMIACSLRLISSAERIGRYGKDIANVVLATYSDQRFDDLVSALSLPHMASLVIGMINDSLEAYRNEDLTRVAHHSARDDTVDALRHTIFRDGITYMMEDPRTITRCTNYLMVARYLERCGDHACKIAEKVTYMVTGDQIEIR
ncbi:MAG: phosphate signaling complex protein PhoU [Methanoregulaceae archaeon]|nr:phosphate signaling complex protein PhoU [Methanoregulaceae archaeon]